MAKIQLKPEAIRILREVQKQIRKAPTSFDMNVVAEAANGRGENKQIMASIVINHELMPPCNTTACIAGHVLLKSGQPTLTCPLSRAADILGLPFGGDDDVASSLFFAHRWPKYRLRDRQLTRKLSRLDLVRESRIDTGKSTRIINSRIKRVIKERGRLAIKRIDLLINKGI